MSSPFVGYTDAEMREATSHMVADLLQKTDDTIRQMLADAAKQIAVPPEMMEPELGVPYAMSHRHVEACRQSVLRSVVDAYVQSVLVPLFAKLWFADTESACREDRKAAKAWQNAWRATLARNSRRANHWANVAYKWEAKRAK